MKPFIILENAVPVIFSSPFPVPLNWQMNEGEVWTVLGPNGSGKSYFARVIGGEYNLQQGTLSFPFMDEISKLSGSTTRRPQSLIKTIAFNSVFSIADFEGSYYQQRFNSSENEMSPCVSDIFSDSDFQQFRQMSSLLEMKRIRDRRLMQLSSGELRKLLIAKSLLEHPRMLILDHPFMGLDEASRHQLNDFLHDLVQKGLQLFFLVPSESEIPSCTTHLLKMNEGRIEYSGAINQSSGEVPSPSIGNMNVDWSSFPDSSSTFGDEMVRMENVDISYGSYLINRDINWTIRRGEKWALLGPNGSGKSTLLSYIFADHPQAYSKKLFLFGRKRGSGESIWDIKRGIGYTSSEMHLYYKQNISCLKVVASGFFDTIGLYRQCNDSQIAVARYVMQLLYIDYLAEQSFLRISSGEQRMTLFARSFVKNPELLILDEPFHGLDDHNKRLCLQLLAAYSAQPEKSLVFVTHHKDEIPTYVDKYLMLKSLS
jgi:molybdate transport system ATP-binding protein